MEILKKIQVNISLDLLGNMLKHTRFIKDLISNKKKLSEEVIPFSKKCSCI